MTGHGNIRFNENEILNLRNFIKWWFLHADDNYGMNESFRREMKKVFLKKIGLSCQKITTIIILTLTSQMDYQNP